MGVQITPPYTYLINNTVSLSPSPLTISVQNLQLEALGQLGDNDDYANILGVFWNTGTTYQLQLGVSYIYKQGGQAVNKMRIYIVHRNGSGGYAEPPTTIAPQDVKAFAVHVVSNTTILFAINEDQVYQLTSTDFGLAQVNYTFLALGYVNGVTDKAFSCGEVACWNVANVPSLLAGAMSFGPMAVLPANQLHIWPFGVNATPNYQDILNQNKAWSPAYQGYNPSVAAQTVKYVQWYSTSDDNWYIRRPLVISSTKRNQVRRPYQLRRKRRMLYVKQGETSSQNLRVYFQLYTTDGVTAATNENGGQPEISINGGSWQNTGISTLTHIGFGRYYATLSASTVQSLAPGSRIETRYKSANTCECPGDTVIISHFVPAYQDLANTILAKLDGVADKLNDMIENAGTYFRYKDQAARDWTSDERAQIRKALGVSGAQSPVDPNGLIAGIAASLYWAEMESQIVSPTEVRWIARWYKTEQPIVASNVYMTIKDTTGNSVFSNMAASSQDGGYTFVLSTSNTVQAGAPYVMTVQSTVDGQVRAFSQIVRPQ